MAFLTKGLKINISDLRDEENIKKAEFHFEGGLNSFVEYLVQNKEKFIQSQYILKKMEMYQLKLLFNIQQHTQKIYTHLLITLILLRVELI